MRRRRPRIPMTDISDLSSKVTTLSRRGKAPAWPRLRLRISCSWQIAGDRLIDGPRPEDGTDFSSYATGPSAHVPGCDCCRVVVAGHAYHLGARADRSQRQTVVRVLCAVP